jgi:hypothetical protein
MPASVEISGIETFLALVYLLMAFVLSLLILVISYLYYPLSLVQLTISAFVCGSKYKFVKLSSIILLFLIYVWYPTVIFRLPKINVLAEWNKWFDIIHGFDLIHCFYLSIGSFFLFLLIIYTRVLDRKMRPKMEIKETTK